MSYKGMRDVVQEPYRPHLPLVQQITKTMYNKIKIAIIDDDNSIHDILHHFIDSSNIAEVKYDFTDPQQFIKEAHKLDFDLCFLDISMPGMDGLTVAQLLNKKPVVFVTGSDDKLKCALELSPVDIITKPFTHERVNKALQKFGINHIEYGLFNIAESSKKVSIHLPDILFVGTDDDDARNKMVVIKGGLKYTLMNYSLNEMKNAAPHLVQVNRNELVALDLINNVTHDTVVLKHADYEMPKEITLTNTHRNELARKMFYK